jgi:hypothetical protein
MQTGWPEDEVPFYGWCGHVDGIWSGGAGAPQGRDDPEFDPVQWVLSQSDYASLFLFI